MSVGGLPTPSHPPGGPQSLLAGGRASEAFRRPPTGQEGHLPPREGSLPPGGQNPITLEYQIYPPTIDTIVTRLHPPGTPGIPTGRPSRNRSRCTISPRASPRKVPCKQENNELTQKDILFNTKNLRLRQYFGTIPIRSTTVKVVSTS